MKIVPAVDKFRCFLCKKITFISRSKIIPVSSPSLLPKILIFQYAVTLDTVSNEHSLEPKKSCQSVNVF